MALAIEGEQYGVFVGGILHSLWGTYVKGNERYERVLIETDEPVRLEKFAGEVSVVVAERGEGYV